MEWMQRSNPQRTKDETHSSAARELAMSRPQQQQMIPVVRSQPQAQAPAKTVRAAAWSSPPASYSARDAAMAGAADPGAPTSVRFHYGRNRIALILSNALTPDDLQHILRSVFQLTESVVGVFEPERQVIFPFSLLTKCPAVFTAEYYLVLERSGVAVPNAAASSSAAEQRQREAVLIDSEGSDFSASSSMSPTSSSAYSSPAASPPRPQGRKQAQAQAASQTLQPYDRSAAQSASQQRQQQQQPQSRPSRTGAQQAYSKAQALARLAESSPVVSSPEASEESDVNSSFDEADGDSQFSDYSERSDQKRDLAAEEAEFDRAVVRAMAAEKQGQSPFKKPQPRATTAGQTRGQQQASAAVTRVQQQQRTQQQQQQSDAAELALQERLLSELGGYDSNGQDGGVDGDVAEALRQEFWQRERERHWIEAETKVLAAEAQKLAQQRQHIAQLKRQQAALQAEQAQALAEVQASVQQQQAASHAAAQAASNKVHAATALKSAINGRASNVRATDYNTFDPSEASEPSDVEGSDEDGGSDVEQSVDESEDAGEEPVHPASDFPFPKSFGLDARELQELDLLQHRAGFASVSPAQLMHLFSRRVDARGNLSRADFEQATREFIMIAHGSSSSATAVSGREKADLVLRRLFDLFKDEGSSSVPFAAFATGLSILCQGDRDSKMLLALAQFDPAKSGYLSLDALAAYLAAFFTVLLDLSVSLQSSVLRSVDLEELAYATAAKCWNDLGVDESEPISFAQFRTISEGGEISREFQPDQSEHEEEEEEYESEEEEEDAEREAADARAWLQRLRAQQAAMQTQRQQQQRGAAGNGQRAAPSQQQQPIRPRL